MRSFLVSCMMFMAVACSPTVKVQAPTEPIVINLNINIEHKIKVQIDKELDELFAGDEELF